MRSEEAQLGNYILTDGGKLTAPLKAGLGLLEPGYRELDYQDWHMAIVVIEGEDPLIFEGWFPRARVVPLSTYQDYRIHWWLDQPPSQAKVDRFVASRLGALYDPACYLWTIMARALHLPMPRINDRLFTCWELAADFALWFGEPWHDMYAYPLITDFLRAEGEIP